jgi:1-acyl-sn-glycerol-3-phosphate acyltransferase
MLGLPPMIILLRSLIATIVFFIHTVLSSFVTVLIGPFFSTTPRFMTFVTKRFWPWPIIRLSGMDLQVRGLENWPKSSSGTLVLFNHTSWIDIPVLYYGLPAPMSFGAKEELFRIPVFGGALRRSGGLPIFRSNRAKTLEVYRDAVKNAPGRCFALAPEGTRQDGMMLGKFKQGPFFFAISGQMAIVPVLIAGAGVMMPRTSVMINMRHSKVILEILPAVFTDGLSLENVTELQTKVRAMMEAKYNALNAELGLI